jgi:hypothetical protein
VSLSYDEVQAAMGGESMVKKLKVLYDGDVLRPQESVDLKTNTYYQATIQEDADESLPDEAASTAGQEAEFPLAKFTKYAIDTGISDLAQQHDHYLYGTPKRWTTLLNSVKEVHC